MLGRHRIDMGLSKILVNESRATRRTSICSMVCKPTSLWRNAGHSKRIELLGRRLQEKRTRPETGLAVYTMSSLLTDKAEPSEALSATVAWSYGSISRIMCCLPSSLMPSDIRA